MLIPNLSVLLAERRLTISRVSEDTRISRTTLTALASRGAKGIQFETLNTLCQYLKVTPDALFIYRPYDVSASTPGRPGRSAVEFTVRRTARREERCSLDCDAEYILRQGAPRPTLDALRVRLSLPDAGDADRRANADALVRLLQSLPAPALAELEDDILLAFDRNVDPALAPDDYSPELEWPWQA